jgi:hypothetical protein
MISYDGWLWWCVFRVGGRMGLENGGAVIDERKKIVVFKKMIKKKKKNSKINI